MQAEMPVINNNSGQPFSILGDPGAVRRDNAIFSGESLLL